MNEKFHTVSVTAPSDEWVRDDWTVDEKMDQFAQLYAKYLPTQRGRLDLPYDDLNTEVTLVNATKQGAAILHLEVPKIVGIGMLVMSGYDAAADTHYAKRFMKKCSSIAWRLPLPPLEVENRPLFYYALFRLSEAVEGQKWFDLADRVVRKANSLGVALLRSSDCPAYNRRSDV